MCSKKKRKEKVDIEIPITEGEVDSNNKWREIDNNNKYNKCM